ncbi:helix-turn-helix domain-containing protein [Actinomycetota bacterium]
MSAPIAPNRVFTSPRDAELAKDVLATLEGPEGFLSVGQVEDETTPLPPELGRLLQEVLQSVASGSTLTIGAIPPELTTASAASLIGVSRPTLMRMIKDGDLPSHKVGSHTRVKASDVFAFLQARHERQTAAFNELRELLDD